MAFGSLGGFTAAAAKVVLGVESTAFNAELAAAEGTFARTAAGMSGAAGEIAERTLRAGVAQERYQRILRTTSAATLEARTALATYIGEMRRLNDVQNQSTASMSRFERGMIAGGVRGMGMGRALTFASNAFLGGAGFVYAVHAAVKASSDFQGEMRLIQTQALKSRGEVNRMTEAVKRLSGPLATGPMELSKGLYRVESSGYAGAAALKVLTTAAKGARLGHSDLEATVNALVASQKSGIRGSQELGQAMGTLDAIVGAGNTRMEDLTKALASGVIPAAKHAGVDLQGLGAALATLTIHGTPAELAATRLRYSIALLSVQTPKAEKELRSIGLASGELGRKMASEGLVPALELLSEKLKTSGYDAQQQHAILERAFGGGRSYTTILDLLTHLGQLRERFNLISREGTAQMFNSRWQAQVHTAEYAFDKLKASAQVLKIQLGDVLLPTTIKAADGFSNWIGKAANQARVTRDLKEALHDAGEAAKVFAAAMHQAGEIMHLADRAFGGAGHSLKLLVELLLLRKALGFAKTINHEVLNPLRAVQTEAEKAKASLGGIGSGRAPVAGGAAVAGIVPVWRQGDLAALDQRIGAAHGTVTDLRKKQKLAEAEAHDTNANAVATEAEAQAELAGVEDAGIATTKDAIAASQDRAAALETETAATNDLAAATEKLQQGYQSGRLSRIVQPSAPVAAPAASAAGSQALYERIASRYGLPVAEVARLDQFQQGLSSSDRLALGGGLPGVTGGLLGAKLSPLQEQQQALVSYIEAKHPTSGKPVHTSEQIQAARDRLIGVNQAIANEKNIAATGVRGGSGPGRGGLPVSLLPTGPDAVMESQRRVGAARRAYTEAERRAPAAAAAAAAAPTAIVSGTSVGGAALDKLQVSANQARDKVRRIAAEQSARRGFNYKGNPAWPGLANASDAELEQMLAQAEADLAARGQLVSGAASGNYSQRLAAQVGETPARRAAFARAQADRLAKKLAQREAAAANAAATGGYGSGRAPIPVGGAQLQTAMIGGKLHVNRGGQWFLPTAAEQARLDELGQLGPGSTVLRPNAQRGRPSTAPLPASEYVYPTTVTARGLIEGGRQGPMVVRTAGSVASPEEAAAARGRADEARVEAETRRTSAAALRSRANSLTEQARVADQVAKDARSALSQARSTTKLTKAQQTRRADLQSRVTKLNRQMRDLSNGVVPTDLQMIGGVPHYADEEGNLWRADLPALAKQKAATLEELKPLSITRALPQAGQAGAVKELEAQAVAKRKLADAANMAASSAQREATAATKVETARRQEAEQTTLSAEAAQKAAADQAALAREEQLAAEQATASADAQKAIAAATTPQANAVRSLRAMRGEIQQMLPQAQQLVEKTQQQAAAYDTVDSSVRKLTADEIAERDMAANRPISEPVGSPLITQQTPNGTLRYGRLRGGLMSSFRSPSEVDPMGLAAPLDNEIFLAEKQASFARARAMAASARAPFQRFGNFMNSPEFGNRSMMYGGALMMAPMMIPGLNSGRASGLTNMLMGAGGGLMVGQMLQMKNPLIAGAIGASFGVRSMIGGRHGSTRSMVGSTLGNVAEGAALGATVGTLGGPLDPLTVPAGAALGGAIGLGLSLIKLVHSTDHTAESLMKLSSAAATAGRNVSAAKQAEFQGRNQLQYDRSSRFDAGQSLKEAGAQERAARGTQAHAQALLQLKTAQAQWREANRLVLTDLHNLKQAHVDVEHQTELAKKKNDQLVASLVKVGTGVDKTSHIVVAGARGMGVALITPAQKAEMFADKMDKIADKARATNPKLARTATALAQIARETDKIPTDPKYVRVILKFGYDPASLKNTENAVKIAFGDLLGGKNGLLNGLLPSDLKPGNDATTARWNGSAWVGPDGKPIRNQGTAMTAWLAKHGPTKIPKGAKIPMPKGANAAPHTGSGSSTPHYFHPSEDTKLGHLEEQIAYFQARGEDSKVAPLLHEEIARLWDDFKRATNDVQRSEVLSAINAAKSQLASIASAGLRNGGRGILPMSYQHNINTAVQSGSKPREIKAYEAAEKWLRSFMAKQDKGSVAYKKADDLLTQYAKKVRVLEKGEKATPTDFFKNDPTWKKLLNNAYKAEQTTNTTSDDIAALRHEQTYLKRIVARASEKHDMKLQLAANKLLAGIDTKLARLVKDQRDLLKGIEAFFLTEQASFYGQYGSNDFTPGSKPPVMVNVNQHFPHPPSVDGSREASYAAHAMGSAFAT
jgi:TP901 family phage tail tape measure protein